MKPREFLSFVICVLELVGYFDDVSSFFPNVLEMLLRAECSWLLFFITVGVFGGMSNDQKPVRVEMS